MLSADEFLQKVAVDESVLRDGRIFEVDWLLVKQLQQGDLVGEDEIWKRVQNVAKRCGADGWARPSNYVASNFNKYSGWQPAILKAHQALATIWDNDVVEPSTPGQQGVAGDQTERQQQQGGVLTNATETLSLLIAGKRLAMENERAEYGGGGGGFGGDKYGGDLYDDYHHGGALSFSNHSAEDMTTASKIAGRMSSNNRSTADTSSTAAAAIGGGGVVSGADCPVLGQSSVKMLISLRDKLWTGSSSTLTASQSSPDDESGGEEMNMTQYCSWDLTESGEVLVMLNVDVDCMCMAVTSLGRFDAYLWAMFAGMLQELREDGGAAAFSQIHAPKLLCSDWTITRARALHGFRIYRDATGPYRITAAKYEWYVTLLTSGSLRAVQDTFHDLANEIWHAHFIKGDTESCRRLEKLLVALLGHENDMVRSQASVFLNNLYDQHDWQQDFPFLPVVRCVGDRFHLEVTVNDDADYKLNQTPNNVMLILSAPSFETTAEIECYTYHFLQWKPAVSVSSHKYKRLISRRTGGKHTWIGTVDFGAYPRCGYYDWRIVRCDQTTGSWEVVQSTIAELRQHFESSYSFVNVLDGGGNGGNGGPMSFRSKSLWPELGRLREASFPLYGDADTHGDGDTNLNTARTHGDGDATLLQIGTSSGPTTLPLQGRFIIHPRDVRKEQVHEIFVDQVGARIEDDGNVKERGSFAKVSAQLKSHSDLGVSAIFLAGCLARDNGEAVYTQSGEQLFERPDASPFAVTCRATPCALLGGPKAFTDLMREAQRVKVKILIDSLARVSSSRAHRKYWPNILYTIDEQGKRQMLYGTDGRSVIFEESCQLNYRKLESWDLLIQDIVAWKVRMGVNGVKLDNAHLMPQIMKADDDELNR